MLKVAIIGLGKMGLLHSAIFSRLRDVKVIAICEKNVLLSKFAKKALVDIEIISQVSALAGIGINAVVVTTPPSSHYSIIKELIKDSICKNILVEKPFSISHEQSQELFDIAQKNGCITMVGYNKRFGSTFQKAKELLTQEVIGDICSFNTWAFSSDFFGMGKPSKQALSRGGVLKDIGCHAIDMTNWLLGKFEIIEADIETNRYKNEVYSDSVFVKVIGEKNIKGSIKVSWRMEDYRLPQIGLEITGTKGSILVDEDSVNVTGTNEIPIKIRKDQARKGVPYFLGETDYYLEDLNFINAIVHKKDASPDFKDGLAVDFTINEIMKKSGIHER